MGSAHTSVRSETQPTREIRRVTWWGLIVNLLLAAVKFVFGVVGASHALVADAVHSLSDSVTDVAVLIGARYWSAPADADHPHGHGRIETIITLLIGAALAVVGIGLGYSALVTLGAPAAAPPGWIAFAAACVSIVAKELLYQWTTHVGRRVKSSALIANAWHHRSDGFSSVPVAVAVLGARLIPQWTFLDPVAAVIVSVFILQAAWQIVWPALKQLSDSGASAEAREKLRGLVASTTGVKAVHALRTRHIGHGLQVDLHVLVDPQLTVRAGHDIAHSVKDILLRDGPEVVDVLVHIEPFDALAGRPAVVQDEVARNADPPL